MEENDDILTEEDFTDEEADFEDFGDTDPDTQSEGEWEVDTEDEQKPILSRKSSTPVYAFSNTETLIREGRLTTKQHSGQTGQSTQYSHSVEAPVPGSRS